MSEISNMDKCGMCKYWRSISQDSSKGRCNRYPPSAFALQETINADHWCGEFRANIEQMRLWESKK